MDELITVIEQTNNEKELCLEIEKMEEKYENRYSNWTNRFFETSTRGK